MYMNSVFPEFNNMFIYSLTYRKAHSNETKKLTATKIQRVYLLEYKEFTVDALFTDAIKKQKDEVVS